MNARCENCEFWKELEYAWTDIDDRSQEVGRTGPNKEPVTLWGTCKRITSGDRYEDGLAGSQLAFTNDGSDYWSALNTRADFGCVEFKAKDDPR